ncbi:YcfL family protein [Hafnia alvei]|uniref:Uncharacterized conserved protein YcfL n=1 Tax=Hafnia alvei TaxID=569 RepID=A0A1C6YWN4_HAFAL|nr:DUF1425 domain-containing protein [Hafnia alvei]NLS55967.1 DUF1425 domain-containing protein [Hafnia alvei]SCM51256.1 Uncharacterized conserved protein YcfL [Hafnia alvei]
MRFSLSRCTLTVILPLALLAGCSTPSHIAVSDGQRVVMDPSVLTAGVTADNPTVSSGDIYPVASAVVNYGEEQQPVTLNYRFYWYDAKGLDIFPHEPPRTIKLNPGQEVRLESTSANTRAKQVRLYLYL